MQSVSLPLNVSDLKEADYKRISDLEKTYKQTKRINDPRFGEIHILQN